MRDRLKKMNTDHILSLFIHNVKDYAIFLLDPDGYIQTWNEGAQNLLVKG